VKKVKIELEDVEGGKYNLSLEGNMSKDKIIEIFELMELLELRGQKLIILIIPVVSTGMVMTPTQQ
jgi:hypothetical protein